MQKDKAICPIGVFDSGIGGLTVAKALVEQLPQESLVYFGDTAHLPYGEKSAHAIQSYSMKIVDFLLERNCKLIVIACNSASAAAYDVIREHIGDQAILVDVIDPMVEFLHANYAGKRIGLIGTRQTVRSNVYQKKIAALHAGIELTALATPLFVPAIEEGFFEHKIIDAILEEYLAKPELQNIEALVLACTHYPVIKASIANYYKDKIAIVDSSSVVAAAVKRKLKFHDLHNQSNVATKQFYVSDYTDGFAAGTKLFFPENIELQYNPL